MNRVVHFEIPALYPGKLARFYREVFGWKITRKGDYYFCKTGSGPGIDGAIYMPGKHHVNILNAIQVKDMDKALGSIVEKGGTHSAVRNIKGLGKMAHCKDIEGNHFAVVQMTR